MSGRQQSADKIHQPCADQVAYPFDIRHDARNQRARTIGVVKADRQSPYVLLNLLAQVGDHPLPSLG